MGKDLSSDGQQPHRKLGMAVNAPVIPAMEAEEAEGLLGLQPASLAK